MKKKTWIRLAIAAFSLLFVSSLVLAVHIYQVTHQNKTNEEMRQLSRIDFKEPVSTDEAAKIRAFVAGLDGVDGTYFNVNNGVLVYTYVIGKQNSEDVFRKLMASGSYKAEPYHVDKAQAATGCPAMDSDDSFRSRITRFIAAI